MGIVIYYDLYFFKLMKHLLLYCVFNTYITVFLKAGKRGVERSTKKRKLTGVPGGP